MGYKQRIVLNSALAEVPNYVQESSNGTRIESSAKRVIVELLTVLQCCSNPDLNPIKRLDKLY